MLTESVHATLAMAHFSFSAQLAALFAAVLLAYLLSMAYAGSKLSGRLDFMVHTLYLLWQSNIAFVAVVSLSVALDNQRAAGAAMAGWGRAPAILPAAAILYASCLALSVAIARYRRRARPGA